MQLGLPEVCWAALKDGQVPIFWPLNRRQFLYLLIIPSNRYCHILCWSLFHTFVFFMFFPFCRFPEFLVSWCSSRSRCPSISESASVLLLRRRMPSADVVSGIFWMKWRESRIIYFLKEIKSFFASFVSFPRSKLQSKEVAGPQRSDSEYQREDARYEHFYHFARTIHPPVTQVNLRKFQFSMSLTSCAFRWHKQYDNCNRFHFQVLIILMYLINIFINKEGEKSSRDKLKRENETLRSPKNGPSGLVQRVQVHPTRGTWRILQT